MRKVVGGKLYNTETAEEICEWGNYYNYTDFKYCKETLYKTKKDNWFLYGKGGAMSKYSQPYGNSGRGPGSDIVPLDREGVIEWLEERDEVGLLEEHFPDYVEEA